MGQRILVIEDSAVIRRLIEVCLRAADLEILMREDGPSGLDAVRTESPDLLVLDLGLPGRFLWWFSQLMPKRNPAAEPMKVAQMRS